MKTARKSIENDPRWAAVVARDRSFDGDFYYSVETTGVFCRPSCGSRRPNPSNVRFHASPEAAQTQGYRACKRCKPNARRKDEQHAATIAHLCRRIESSDPAPSLSQLADEAGLSASQLHRIFKATTGLTPKGYATAHRAKQVRSELKVSPSVTDAIYKSGFASGGRFYAKSDAMLGMTPSEYRAGGANNEIRFAVGECSLGSILVAKSERGVCAILLGDDPEELLRDLQDRFPRGSLIGGDRSFERLVAKVVGFVETPALGLDLPLDVRGTAFQQRVWQALRDIPAGTTTSYTELAKRIGSPSAVRAVASACAANAIAVAIPCHRVVRTDGALSGYRWGIERKRELLEREKR